MRRPRRFARLDGDLAETPNSIEDLT